MVDIVNWVGYQFLVFKPEEGRKADFDGLRDAIKESFDLYPLKGGIS